MRGWQRLWAFLGLTVVLSLGGSCRIIGPCNPPQINCVIPQPGAPAASLARQEPSPSAEVTVSFSGSVIIGTPAAGAPTAALPTPTPTPSPIAAASPSTTPIPEPTAPVSPPTSPSPTASPSPSPPPLRLAAVVFTEEGGPDTLRVPLDEAGMFNASLAAGTYRVGIVLAASDGIERTVLDNNTLLTVTTGEAFTLKMTLTLDTGPEALVVEKITK